MTILDEIDEEHERSAQSRRCSVCDFILAQPPDERVQWEAALDDKSRFTTAIFRVMHSHGFDKTRRTVENHRSGHKLNTEKKKRYERGQ